LLLNNLIVDAAFRKMFCAKLGVSRETLDRLSVYGELLIKWQTTINLVSNSTIDDMWRRHFLDSAQIFSLLPSDAKNTLDIGSGAGFPGLVLALMGAKNVTLVESDTRKCMFLKEVLRETNSVANIENCRIEDFTEASFDVITARALAPLDKLLVYAQPYFCPGTIGVFPKGRRFDLELTSAKERWRLKYSLVPSVTDTSGAIIVVEEVSGGPTKKIL
jgi:16S rRNA (guanine527-N7)-methyltransferase